MPVILPTIVLPAITKGLGLFSRLLSAACNGIADHLGRRTAIARLHDLDDRALRDIGLARFQIEAAVIGLVTLSGKADECTLAAATNSRGPQRKPTAEAAPWS